MPLREIRGPAPLWMRHLFALSFAACLIAVILPLWMGRALPAVDWPQHLFLINLMDEMHSPDFAFRDLFESAPGWTYLGFYYSIHFLACVLPLETAFKVFLSLMLAATALAFLFLLVTLKKSRWLSLLAFPLLYTYAFWWGMFSFMAALPAVLFAIACFIRVLEIPHISGGDWEEEARFSFKRRRDLAFFALSALSLIAVQLTHAAAMVFPVPALLLMLILTPSSKQRRIAACLSAVPAALLFLTWLISSTLSGHAPEKGSGQWQARGGLFEAKTYVFQPVAKRLAAIPDHLAGGFANGADRPFLWLWLAALILTLVLGLKYRQELSDGLWRTISRPAALFILAVLAYLCLPTDVTGYMYMIHPRYAQLAALFLIPLLPFPSGKSWRVLAGAFTALGLGFGITHSVLFHRFDAEARSFEPIVEAIKEQYPQGARIMHLVTGMRGRVAQGAVYLHYAALAAARTHSIPSFSLARHDPFPVHYSARGKAVVPLPKWEWRPERYDWKKEASWFDLYLVHPWGNQRPESVFGRDARRVELVAQSDGWSLWKKREAPPKRHASGN